MRLCGFESRPRHQVKIRIAGIRVSDDQLAVIRVSGHQDREVLFAFSDILIEDILPSG